MNNMAISTRGLSKRYRLGELDSVGTIVQSLGARLRSPFHRKNLKASSDIDSSKGEIWALKDINLEIQQGEILGLIGPNGSGKTTLLKVLARITEPTTGYAEISGRVGTLLEVGTGFHQELTGRENVFLSGSILGMKTSEIKRQFDQIVEFAGVERFIDTPVKRFSTGMAVRLAFSVAAHLQAEILFVDEVLAVGDAAFQQKCIGAMGELGQQGRTLVFVSHNMNSISALCTRAVLLTNGQIASEGTTEHVVTQYLNGVSATPPIKLSERVDREGEGSIRIVDAWIRGPNGDRNSTVRSGDALTFVFEYECNSAEPRPDEVICWARIKSVYGQTVCFLNSYWSGSKLPVGTSREAWTCSIDRFALTPGHYILDLDCNTFKRPIDHIQEAMTFDVIEGNFFRTTQIPPAQGVGVFWMEQKWGTE